MVSLVFALFLVVIPVTSVFLNLERLSRDSDHAEMSAGNFQASIPKTRFMSTALMWGTTRTAHIIGAIDIPGSIAMIPGHPADMTLDAWRSFILPFSSLPFWWLAGTGLDIATRRFQASWPLLLLGSTLMLAFLTMLIGLRFGLSESERTESEMTWVYWGMLIWSLLFSSFPYAWVQQARQKA